MTVWIPEYLSKAKVESNDAQTLYLDLPRNEQISFLQVQVAATDEISFTSLETGLIDDIEKYEVIADGSKALYNLEPELAYYNDFITRNGILPPMGFNAGPGSVERHEFIIPFGRYMYDEEYLLDTSLYNTVQLRIPYNIDNSRFQAGTFTHSIVLWRPLEKLSPTGFIRSRAIRKETHGTAIGTEMHDLPMTFPLRYLAARFEDVDANISSDVSSIKLNIDEGRLILADMNINEWLDLDKKRYPPVSQYTLNVAVESGEDFKAHLDSPWAWSIESSGVAAMMLAIGYARGETTNVRMWDHAGVAIATSQAMTVKFTGSNPHKCLTLYDGRKAPFEVARYTEGKVEYTMTALETIIHTFAQEVVPGALT